MDKESLIVLGSSLTALGIIRSARKNNIPCCLLDTTSEIAYSSNIPVTKILLEENLPECKLLHELKKMGGCRNHLIATSDIWLQFLIKHREEIEESYIDVLHPVNEDLKSCLNKGLFYDWCLRHNLSTPFSVATSGLIDISGFWSANNFPAIIRPIAHVYDRNVIVPKSIEVNSFSELRNAEKFYKDIKQDFIVSRSLLSEELIQYSVPFARARKGELVSFVAVKKRPFPEQCGVGSYVKLEDNSEINSFAIDVINSFQNYYGIGEVEILYSIADKKKYLIEVNARPWTQFALAEAAGYNFLRHLLGPSSNSVKTKSKHCNWISLDDDLFNCFSSSVGLVRHRKLDPWNYLISILKANVFPTFNIKDPKPFWVTLKRVLKFLSVPRRN